MKRFAFVVPCHGREQLARACMRQLARTCAAAPDGLDATAVLVGAEAWVEELADELGFAFVRAANSPLGRKWNDAFEHAGRGLGADYVVACGSDDFVHPVFLAELPEPGRILCSRASTVVSPDGRELAHLNIGYDGGDGMRVMPLELLERLAFRPVEDSRERAIDTSIHMNLRRAGVPPRFVYRDLDPMAIVDFKSPTEQLNSYADCATAFGVLRSDDPWGLLGEWYDADAIAEVRSVFDARAAAMPVAA